MNQSARLSLASLTVLLAALPALAGLPKAEKKEAERMLKGRLYMRIDAPCATGRHPYGTYKSPVVEVSAAGVNTDDGAAFNAGWWVAQSTYWGIRVNDPVELDGTDWDEDWVEIELKGVGSAEDNETVIKFVKVNSLEDFKAAFDRAFARSPLQDEHADWPEDIRKAIGERKLVNGMTKRQAFYVTGNPERSETTQEGGKKVEVWTLRQSKGMRIGYWGVDVNESTQMPSTIRFEDGKLVTAVDVKGGTKVNLDD